ncbi:GIY-YIG nuclease family protein [Paenarthrobacter nitroguajacolicus]
MTQPPKRLLASSLVDAQSPEEQPLDRIWTTPLPCEQAWVSTPKAKVAGVYMWFLAGDLPAQFNWPAHLTQISQGDLIYVGKATNLRTRAKHHKLQTYSSSLQRTLASLMGFPAVWQGKSAHPGLSNDHHATLKEWMTENLKMSFSELVPGEVLAEVEKAVRKACKAPLNKDDETTEQLHVLDVGQNWQANAEHR